MAAILQIDILRDGASAIYGTDAIAGVVNIVSYQENQRDAGQRRLREHDRYGLRRVSGVA